MFSVKKKIRFHMKQYKFQLFSFIWYFLIIDSLNQRSIKDIETAVLCVCFDEKHPDLVNCEAQVILSQIKRDRKKSYAY